MCPPPHPGEPSSRPQRLQRDDTLDRAGDTGGGALAAARELGEGLREQRPGRPGGAGLRPCLAPTPGHFECSLPAFRDVTDICVSTDGHLSRPHGAPVCLPWAPALRYAYPGLSWACGWSVRRFEPAGGCFPGAAGGAYVWSFSPQKLCYNFSVT